MLDKPVNCQESVPVWEALILAVVVVIPGLKVAALKAVRLRSASRTGQNEGFRCKAVYRKREKNRVSPQPGDQYQPF